MAEPLLIEIHNATIWRGTTCVFDKFDLAIARHQRVAIIGPNGSGKTTLLKTINGELHPVARENSWVRILGRDDWNVWDLRKRIGTVSHDLHSRYTPAATALEVVVSGFFSSIGVHGLLIERVTDEQRKRANNTLKLLGIESLRNTPLRSMSTGQQRRCLLGRALVHEPDTLILDEPTAGLDFAASFDYFARLRQLAASGCNIVLVTHNLNEIPPEIERVVILKAGTIVADGDKSAVLTGEILSSVYETAILVARTDDYFLAYPG
ncbi:MAG: ATP-binding cassette domain-containing protein [Proteobacteria bacterium]|nr:ATP-binding cassette domain-containing protein [Pseudomonadota bacterium]